MAWDVQLSVFYIQFNLPQSQYMDITPLALMLPTENLLAVITLGVFCIKPSIKITLFGSMYCKYTKIIFAIYCPVLMMQNLK